MFKKMSKKFRVSGLVAAMLGAMSMTSVAMAGEASSDAWANSHGSAGANAAYNGDGRGWAKTTTRTGNVNYGRGTSFGIDRDGVSFSVSQALAPRFGPALASTFNVSIGFDGDVNTSHGSSIARGGNVREVNAGGFASSNRYNGGTSGATAGGRTGPSGRVVAETKSNSRRVFWKR